MNGKEVRLWKGLRGFPNKLLPDGQVFGSTGLRNPNHSYQDQTDLVQVDWEGNIVWRFSRLEHIADPGQEPRWYARQHHDFQREGNSVGYYVPARRRRTIAARRCCWRTKMCEIQKSQIRCRSMTS